MKKTPIPVSFFVSVYVVFITVSENSFVVMSALHTLAGYFAVQINQLI
ncbi:MAG: hypothetical protein IJ078_06195 [Succinivibrionaceae bacterium]|nr:hypothetical protein [Succinivibrionaceae bacterium]